MTRQAKHNIEGLRRSAQQKSNDTQQRAEEAIALLLKERRTINFNTVRNMGLRLPGVEESTAYGQPALKIHGKLLACLPAHRSAEPASLVVSVDFHDRAELLAGRGEDDADFARANPTVYTNLLLQNELSPGRRRGSETDAVFLLSHLPSRPVERAALRNLRACEGALRPVRGIARTEGKLYPTS